MEYSTMIIIDVRVEVLKIKDFSKERDFRERSSKIKI